MKRRLITAMALALCTPTLAGDDPVPTATAPKTIHGFQTSVQYLDDNSRALGTRYVHKGTGMPIVILDIESVPQAFIWINTPPTSDRGEPHAGEHLLLGKGSKGKGLAERAEMSLADSTAWTAQTKVCYSFYTSAGKETFFGLLQGWLDALLLPNYSDEEIRREVCNLGIKELDGKLVLEEKGTVYTEMVSSFEKSWTLFDALGRRVYGAEHPLAHSAGGTPEALRATEPKHINDFHAAHYHLSANMGLLVSLPSSISHEELLAKLSKGIDELEKDPTLKARPKALHSIPAPKPSSDHSLLVHPFPTENEQERGYGVLAWPAAPVHDVLMRERAALFLSTIASGDTATLYPKLLDSKRRVLELDATGLWGDIDRNEVGIAPSIGIRGISPAHADEAFLKKLSKVIQDELARVSELAPGSKELLAFNEKVKTRLASTRKGIAKELSSPPLFGHRGAGGFWFRHLERVDLLGGDTRSLTLAKVFSSIEKELDGKTNPWTQVVETLGLLSQPYLGISIPSASEAKHRSAAKKERLRAALEGLKKELGGATDQEVLSRYKTKVDAATKLLEAQVAGKPPSLIADIPLSLDPDLEGESLRIGGVPTYAASFKSMTTAELAVYLDLSKLNDAELVYLPLITSLITGIGLKEGDAVLDFESLIESLGRETSGLSTSYSTRPSRGRYELLLRASGVDVSEAKRAIDWLGRCLFGANLDEANLGRVRDLAIRLSRSLWGRLSGSEESWVHDPANAIRYQRDHLFLSTSSVHTKLLHAFRLRWMLEKPFAEKDQGALEAIFALLGEQSKSGLPSVEGLLDELGSCLREERKAKAEHAPKLTPLLTQIAGADHKRLGDIIGSLKPFVAALDPGNLEKDIAELGAVLKGALAVTPAVTLGKLRALLAKLRNKGGLRLALTCSAASRAALLPAIEGFVGRFPDKPVAAAARSNAPVVFERLRGRRSDLRAEGALAPVHLALVNQASRSGVFVFSAGVPDMREAPTPESLVDYLAGAVYAGHGAHGFFMNTWGAGLAYSNGMRIYAKTGRLRYYAERCPDLVETMKFVVKLLKDGESKLDEKRLSQYALSIMLSDSRASDRFEQRCRAQAADLVDGDSPERIAAFRKALLALRTDAELWERMKPKRVSVAGRVLVGAGAKSRDQNDAVFLVIAPGALIANWERYVKEQEGADERVDRLYPRDFWLLD